VGMLDCMTARLPCRDRPHAAVSVSVFTAWVHDQVGAGWQWGGAPRRLPMSLGLYPRQGVRYDFFCQVLYSDQFHPAAALFRRTSGCCARMKFGRWLVACCLQPETSLLVCSSLAAYRTLLAFGWGWG
jgi:hypothetical protein